MSKRIAFSCITLILLLPMMFIGSWEEMTLSTYLVRCTMPITIVIVFCINYYKLVPNAMRKADRGRLVIYNTVVVIAGCVFLTGCHRLLVQNRMHIEEKARTEARLHDKEEMNHERQTIRRMITPNIFNALNLIFAIVVAYSIRSKEHINELELRQQEIETARQKAEQKSLRNLISPHFLLNTLNNIYALAAISPERTQSAVMQLSKLLRHTLYDNQQETVSLKSEAEFIMSYINLMRLRLTSNVHIETDIHVADNSQTTVAPLLFISLVENAFKHGVTGTTPCLISIALYEEQGTIICDIANSNNPKTPSDHSGHGIGLQLVRQRLEAIYQGRYKWEKWIDDNNIYHSRIEIC